MQIMETNSHSIYQVIALTHFGYFTVIEPVSLVTEKGKGMQLPEFKN